MRKLRFLAVMLLSLLLWQSTEIMAAPTAASATVGDKTVNYSYEFTESGGDVTFSITITSITDGGVLLRLPHSLIQHSTTVMELSFKAVAVT